MIMSSDLWRVCSTMMSGAMSCSMQVVTYPARSEWPSTRAGEEHGLTVYNTFARQATGKRDGQVMDGEKSHSQRTIEGQRRAAKEGRFPGRPMRVSDAQIRRVMHLGTTEAARRVGLSRAQFIARRKRIKQAQETA